MNATIKEVLYDASITIARLNKNLSACMLERSRNDLRKVRTALSNTEGIVMLAMNKLQPMDMDCKVFNVNIKETKDDTKANK